MKSGHRLKALGELLSAPRPEPARQAELIVSVQRRIVLPVKSGLLVVVLYFLFSSDWLSGTVSTRTVVLQTLRGFFLAYVICNVIAAVILVFWRRFAPEFFQWLVFVLGLLDGLFVAALTLMTGGSASIAFWLFPVLIVLNAMSIPTPTPQITLNLLLSVFYAGAGALYANLGEEQIALMYVPGHAPPRAWIETNAPVAGLHPAPPAKARKPIHWDSSINAMPEDEITAESFVLRLFVLLLLTACCYEVQVLVERQRRELEEAREFALREGQLRSAGRLAAEFAHQIKNPLAVIASAAYSLQRSLREDKNSAAQQLEIIQEEVTRADRVITRITGYAQLSEGRVEKLDVVEELDRAIARVFPPAVPTAINIHRRYPRHCPPLLMQRGHLSEMLVNLLKNARESLPGTGNIFVSADCRPDESIDIWVRDDGPGIAPDKIARIFEAYYTTKEKGTGLGLAIVRHYAELYGGAVRVESTVGNGAAFILTFHSKVILNARK